ncbi:MAG TPA: lipase maturation factor family protein [Candidatus Gracilibacteria bacterium]|nr:lipase maturation factor family protein [Candidatus Gracilibacteria bacterium]
MDFFGESTYWLTRFIFLKGLGLIYLTAFWAAFNQFRALLGTNGILPVTEFIQQVPFKKAPSIFYLHYSNRFFLFIAGSGIALSLLTLTGIVDFAPLWVFMSVWLILWVLYMSIVNIGQTWYSFGWESLLLEVGFMAIFLGNAFTEASIIMMFLMRWALFRVEFGAGLIKMRGDKCWKDLTCLFYHYETQPMPNPVSWFAHNAPKWFHKTGVLVNHFVQLVAPIFLFAPQPVASIAGVLIIGTQGWLILSGNYSWLNWLTILLGVGAIDDSVFRLIIPEALLPTGSISPGETMFSTYLVAAYAILVVVRSIEPVKNLISRHQIMNTSFDPLHLVNTYGAFGSVTKKRYEVIIEGTLSDDPDSAKAEWKEYEFKGKPGDVKYMPRQFAPYHLRLDWLMWFAAMGPHYQQEWFEPFMIKLLENDKTVLKLLRKNPFANEPPKYLRAKLYLYHFTDKKERRASKAWWKREYVKEYFPVVSL